MPGAFSDGTYLDVSTTTTTSSDAIFSFWMAEQTAGTIYTGINDTIWRTFTSSGTSTASYDNSAYIGIRHEREIDLQATRERAEREAREREARRIVARRKRREASARAEILLKQALTPAQKAQLKRFGYFFVQGNKSGNTYRIRNGRSLNVDLMQGNKVQARLCAHPHENVPNEDTMLIQKIYLECMEDQFLKLANRQ